MKELGNEFYKPLVNAFSLSNAPKRNNPKISDLDHLRLGVSRCIAHFDSGRDFVQNRIDKLLDPNLSVSNYFSIQKSERRLNLLQSVNEELVENYTSPVNDDPFEELECLDKYAIYAADGHYHKHASHDKHENGKNYPVGHIFAINLRNQTARHIDVTRPTDKKEHEVKVLKRMDVNTLRMGEPTGKKVALIYDRAVIDFNQWFKWKQGSGIYIITRAKKNMKLQCLKVNSYDKEDSINAGIISDEQVGTSKGTMIRRIKYFDSASKKTFIFITNMLNEPPGVIAFMYKKRWEVEKLYDTFKNYYFEAKAWGKANEAKCQQALFLCITHNLFLMLERKVEKETNIKDEKIIAKRKKRREEVIAQIKKENLPLNSLAIKLTRSVQRSKEFLRCFNNMLSINASWDVFIHTLKPHMEMYLT